MFIALAHLTLSGWTDLIACLTPGIIGASLIKHASWQYARQEGLRTTGGLFGGMRETGIGLVESSIGVALLLISAALIAIVF